MAWANRRSSAASSRPSSGCTSSSPTDPLLVFTGKATIAALGGGRGATVSWSTTSTRSTPRTLAVVAAMSRATIRSSGAERGAHAGGGDRGLTLDLEPQLPGHALAIGDVLHHHHPRLPAVEDDLLQRHLDVHGRAVLADLRPDAVVGDAGTGQRLAQATDVFLVDQVEDVPGEELLA